MPAKYYTMDFIVNDIVYISFNQKLETIGIEDTEGYFKVMGHDHMGMWLKHPGIVKIEDVDKKGKPVPKSKRKKEVIEAVFLAHWGNIKTIMHFPNRKGFDFEGIFDKNKIGFSGKK